MVSLRLLALPAVLRRRHCRPLDLQDRRGRPQRRCRARVRRLVAEAVHRRLRAGHQRKPGRSAERFHRRLICLPVERQLAGRGDHGQGQGRHVPARARFRPWWQDRRWFLAVRRGGQVRPSGRRRRVHQVRASGQVSGGVLRRARPDPRHFDGGADDRQLQDRRPAGRVLRPFRKAGAGAPGHPGLRRRSEGLHQGPRRHRQWRQSRRHA